MSSLIARAKAILTDPKSEWPKIAAEATTPADIFTGYVLPLAAIGPVAGFIGKAVFGYSFFGVTIRPTLLSNLSGAVIGYVLSLIGIVVLALVADFLAPKFGGISNRTQAVKLVAYGATASFLAGIFQLVPSLSLLAILGLYSAYLFYTGITPTLKVPEDKRLTYTIVTIIAAIVLEVVVGALSGAVLGAFGGGASAITGATIGDSDKVTLPGGATVDQSGKMTGSIKIGDQSIDLGKLQEQSKQLEAAASQMQAEVNKAQ